MRLGHCFQIIFLNFYRFHFLVCPHGPIYHILFVRAISCQLPIVVGSPYFNVFGADEEYIGIGQVPLIFNGCDIITFMWEYAIKTERSFIDIPIFRHSAVNFVSSFYIWQYAIVNNNDCDARLVAIDWFIPPLWDFFA